MEYSRRTIQIKDQGDIEQILQDLSSLPDLMVVNIAGSADQKPILFSLENLQAILAAAPESLIVEALPIRQYKRLMCDRIDQAIESTLSLRAMLRTQFVAELAAQIREFAARLDRILPLLNCHALQKTKSGFAENMQKLRTSLGQLDASCREHGDNVRCMDDLQYEILPALTRLRKLL